MSCRFVPAPIGTGAPTTGTTREEPAGSSPPGKNIAPSSVPASDSIVPASSDNTPASARASARCARSTASGATRVGVSRGRTLANARRLATRRTRRTSATTRTSVGSAAASAAASRQGFPMTDATDGDTGWDSGP